MTIFNKFALVLLSSCLVKYFLASECVLYYDDCSNTDVSGTYWLSIPSYWSGACGGYGDDYSCQFYSSSDHDRRYETKYFGEDGTSTEYEISFYWKAASGNPCSAPRDDDRMLVKLVSEFSENVVLTMEPTQMTYQTFTYIFSTDEMFSLIFQQEYADEFVTYDYSYYLFILDDLKIVQNGYEMYDEVCYKQDTINDFTGIENDGVFYYYHDTLMNDFHTARSFCKDTFHPASEVAYPTSVDENDFLFSLISEGIYDIWIGVYNMYELLGEEPLSSSYLTMSAEQLSFTNWDYSGYPTGLDCVGMSQADGKWVDESCLTGGRAVICELNLSEEGLSYSTLNPHHNVKYYPHTYCDHSIIPNCPSEYRECNGISYALISEVCSGKGSCDFNQTSLENYCLCESGSQGEECEEILCYDLEVYDNDICRRKGSCIGPNDCDCDDDDTYYGSECQYCLRSFCKSHGDCFQENESPFETKCLCDEGYYNENITFCRDFDCDGIHYLEPDSCGYFATCVSPNECVCDPNVFGVSCHLCNSSMCSERGECSLSEDDVLCDCSDTGYLGDTCEVPVCEGVCLGHGICISPDYCVCEEGYFGSNCENCNISTFCSGKGVCSLLVTDENQASCDCTETGYSGTDCGIPLCNDVRSDDATVCLSHGECNIPNVCECNEGYSGYMCHICNESVFCSDRGICSVDIESLSVDCECFEGYNGTDCGDNLCYGILSSSSLRVCSGHGRCEDIDVCVCEENYYGEDCEITECFGYYSNYPGTVICSGHGTCLNADYCVCEEEYYDDDCGLTTCDLIQSSDEMVCSKHGFCRGFDDCVCEEGYARKDGTGCVIDLEVWTVINAEQECEVCEECQDCDEERRTNLARRFWEIRPAHFVLGIVGFVLLSSSVILNYY